MGLAVLVVNAGSRSLKLRLTGPSDELIGARDRPPQPEDLDVRAAAAAGLGFLGVTLDRERNATATGDADIGVGAAAVRTLVVEAREDLEMAAVTARDQRQRSIQFFVGGLATES